MQLHRAMDFLLTAADVRHESMLRACADLLNLEVDLLSCDTTSVHSEVEEGDVQRAEREALRTARDDDKGSAQTSPAARTSRPMMPAQKGRPCGAGAGGSRGGYARGWGRLDPDVSRSVVTTPVSCA